MARRDSIPGELFERVFESATTGLKIVHAPDPHDFETFRYVAANQHALDALCLDAETVVGHRVVDVFPAVRGTQVETNYLIAATEKRTVDFGETSFPNRDGAVQWYRSYLVHLADGYLGAVFENVTAEHVARERLAEANANLERRVSERTQHLQESRARLAAIFEHAADHILEVDAEGNVLYENGRGECDVRSVFDLAGPGHRDDIAAALKRAGRGTPEHVDLRVRRQGRLFDLSLSIADVQGGGESRFVVIARDSTALRALERRVHLRERMATLGTLAAGIAHEINNPLQHMMLALE